MRERYPDGFRRSIGGGSAVLEAAFQLGCVVVDVFSGSAKRGGYQKRGAQLQGAEGSLGDHRGVLCWGA